MSAGALSREPMDDEVMPEERLQLTPDGSAIAPWYRPGSGRRAPALTVSAVGRS